MKCLVAGELRAKIEEARKHAPGNGESFTMDRVRRFEQADQRLQEACARLGINKPQMLAAH